MESRLRDYLKREKPEQYGSLVKNVIERGQNDFLRPLGKNGFPHSSEVEQTLNKLLRLDVRKLKNTITPEETYVLLAATYLHDVGYRVGDELIPDGHPERSYRYITERWSEYGLADEREAEAVAIVCLAHGGEKCATLAGLRPRFGIPSLSRSSTVDLQFCAALLRLSDELQHETHRVRGFFHQDTSIRQLIPFCDIFPENWSITLDTEPRTYDDYVELARIREYAQSVLSTCRPYLEKRDLLYHVVLMTPEVNPFQEPVEKLSEALDIDTLQPVARGASARDFRLPSPPAAFCGRTVKLDRVREYISLWRVRAIEESYIAILGDSGIGKSSFAIKVVESEPKSLLFDLRACGETTAIQEVIYSVASQIPGHAYEDIAAAVLRTPAVACLSVYKGLLERMSQDDLAYVVVLDQLEATFGFWDFMTWLHDVIRITDSPILLMGCIRTDDVVMQTATTNYESLAALVSKGRNRVVLDGVADDEIQSIARAVSPQLSSNMLSKIAEESDGRPWKAKRLALMASALDHGEAPTDDFLFSLDVRTLGIDEVYVLNQLAVAGQTTNEILDSELPHIDNGMVLSTLEGKGLVLHVGEFYYLYHDRFRRYLTAHSPLKEAETAQSLISTARAFAEKEDWGSVGNILALAATLGEESQTASSLHAIREYVSREFIESCEIGPLSRKYHAIPSFGDCIPTLWREYDKRDVATDKLNDMILDFQNILARSRNYVAMLYWRLMRTGIDCELPPLSLMAKRCIAYILSRTRVTKDGNVAWGGVEANAHETSQAMISLLELGIPESDVLLCYASGYLLAGESQSATAKSIWPYYVGHGKVVPSTYTTAWCIEALSRSASKSDGTAAVIGDAVTWLLAQQDASTGGWSRPDGSSPTSRETAIIISALDSVTPLLDDSQKEDCREAIQAGISFLLNRWRGASIGFVYSDDNAIPSIHSTSYAALAIASLRSCEFNSLRDDLVLFYESHQAKDGGFGYLRGGFSNPVPEASATTIRVLHRIGSKRAAELEDQALMWLMTNQTTRGCWEDGFIHQVASVLRCIRDVSEEVFPTLFCE